MFGIFQLLLVQHVVKLFSSSVQTVANVSRIPLSATAKMTALMALTKLTVIVSLDDLLHLIFMLVGFCDVKDVPISIQARGGAF